MAGRLPHRLQEEEAMNPVIEAMQVLMCSEQELFKRAYAWYYGASVNVETAAASFHQKYTRDRTYPHFVLAFAQSVRRNGRMAA
jgi:hypothetical protein